jgi:hypothetical protein
MITHIQKTRRLETKKTTFLKKKPSHDHTKKETHKKTPKKTAVSNPVQFGTNFLHHPLAIHKVIFIEKRVEAIRKRNRKVEISWYYQKKAKIRQK